jgi:predicted protein tyrosine phosphatase
MPIFVCPLSKLLQMMERHKPTRVVSVLDPGSSFPELGATYSEKHLRLEFHDIHFPVFTYVMPGPAHVDRLLTFMNRGNPEESLLIHCRAGIGRSTATAYIAACFRNPRADEREIAAALRRAAPFARPNEALIRAADDALGRNGRMLAAITESGRNLPPLSLMEGEVFQIASIFPRQEK